MPDRTTATEPTRPRHRICGHPTHCVPLQLPIGLTPIGNANDKDDHDVIED